MRTSIDERPPLQGSGVRIGTPALTTRGMGPEEMRAVAGFFARAIANREDEAALAVLREEVAEFAAAFPVPGITDRQGVPPSAEAGRGTGVRPGVYTHIRVPEHTDLAGTQMGAANVFQATTIPWAACHRRLHRGVRRRLRRRR